MRSRSRLTRQAETEVLWQLKDRNFIQVRGELGVGYGTLRRLLERGIDKVRELRYYSNKMEFEEVLKC